MKFIVHISNDYSGSTVYMNLVRELDNLNIQQIVYNPIRDVKLIGKNSIIFKTEGSKTIYRPILNYHIDRFLYSWKIKKIVKDIQRQIDFSKVNFIHAHTWYSDGGVAYELSKIYNIPYIVAVRSTDIDLFQKKLKYLRPYGRKILNDAQRVILISASFKEKLLLQKSIKPIYSQLTNKLEVIPNGVDPFWLDNHKSKFPLKNDTSFRALYIGTFIKRKKVLALQSAIISLSNSSNLKIHLDLIGDSGADKEEVMKQVEKFPDIFTYHGIIYDKNQLLRMFRSADVFSMPSRNETFGLVYVEAMLQGLPILYTAEEGIDGFYDDAIGEKVSKQSDELEIKKALLKMFDNYNTYQIPTDKLIVNHDWNLIAQKYKELYNL